jgi:hypothetical protein
MLAVNEIEIDEFRAAVGDDTIEFLEKLRPGGPWILTAIEPDGKPITTTANKPTEVRDFVRAHNGLRNLYFSVNPTRTSLAKKATKADIAALEFMLADLDPAEHESAADAKARYQAQLEKFELQPTFVIDSGNGIQLLWRLSAPIVLGEPQPGAKRILSFPSQDQLKIDEAEARSRDGAAQCQSRHSKHRSNSTTAWHHQSTEREKEARRARTMRVQVA